MVKDMRPTPLKFIVTANVSDESSLEIPVTVNLKPQVKHHIPFTTHQIKVDGKADPEIVLNEEFLTDTDNQMHYAVVQNASHLIITAVVQDKDVIIDSSTSLTRQDNIGLMLSFLPAVKSALSPDNTYYLRMTVEKDGQASKVNGAKNFPDDWKYICKATDDGYVFELSIPLKYLDDLQGGDWKSLRLNWTMDDLDVPSSHWQEIKRNSLYPAWGSSSEILGSGMYFRDAQN